MTAYKTLIAVAAAAMFSLGSTHTYAQDNAAVSARVADFARAIASDDHVIGAEDAPNTLIIWASVTCSHCSNWFSKEWPTVKSKLIETGKLRVVFREFPTAPAELAMTGFRLAECAPTEDYMSIIEYQMENQTDIFEAAKAGRASEIYVKIAKMAGMENDEAIASCFKNPDITAHIIDNAKRATLAQVKGVPAFLINGNTYKGKQDAESLVKLINEMTEKGLTTLPQENEPEKSGGHD